MVQAAASDKNLVVSILARAFDSNKSVNYVIPQDGKRAQRIRHLMAYSFGVCNRFGNVFLSADRTACALVLFPDKKKTTAKSLWWDVKLIASSIGIFNAGKVLSREAKIKRLQPAGPLYYLWFIGVDPLQQNKGAGSKLLGELITESERLNRTFCLETSAVQNLPWYQKFGLEIYNELSLSYRLFFLKKEHSVK